MTSALRLASDHGSDNGVLCLVLAILAVLAVIVTVLDFLGFDLGGTSRVDRGTKLLVTIVLVVIDIAACHR